jgi:hypothetical protein
MNKNDNVTKHETEIGALLEQIEQLEADSGNWEGAYKWADEDRNKLEKENQKTKNSERRLKECIMIVGIVSIAKRMQIYYKKHWRNR